MLDVDPYFQPKTEEEQEEYGSEFHEDQFVNVAKDLIDRVRRRKGLDTERKIVIHAEKQRTLGKKKWSEIASTPFSQSLLLSLAIW